jgi:hypothetical protein
VLHFDPPDLMPSSQVDVILAEVVTGYTVGYWNSLRSSERSRVEEAVPPSLEKCTASMAARTATLIIRAIRLAPLVTCIFAGCTCSGTPPDNPTPTVAAHATDTPQPSTLTSLPATPTYPGVCHHWGPSGCADPITPPPDTTALPGTTAPPETPTPDSARRALCERYVALVSGRERDLALLDNPEIKALASQAPPDLIMCGAVAADSDVLCKRLMPLEHGPSMACRHTQAIFHELRTYPNSRSFMFDDLQWEECHHPSLAPALCDSFRQAMRSGDAKDCAQTGDFEPICRAYIGLDASLCRVQGKLQGLKGGADKGYGVDDGFDDICKKTIESRAFLAQGLKVLAQSGPPRERELAKAALGQADACASYAQSAMEGCMGNVSATPVPETPVPSGTAGPPSGQA